MASVLLGNLLGNANGRVLRMAKELVSKTSGPQALVGSSPTPSAAKQGRTGTRSLPAVLGGSPTPSAFASLKLEAFSGTRSAKGIALVLIS
jgi:hypothetical protein